MTKTCIRAIAVILWFAIPLSAGAQAKPESKPATKPGPVTGFDLPRYVSLKADEVNARVGPGPDYSISWVFRRAGLTVEVLNEFENWRQVRDSAGSTGWVASALISGRRTAIVAPWLKSGQLHQLMSSRGGSTVVVQIETGAVVDIATCDSEFCKVYAASKVGYIAQTLLWGIYPSEKYPSDKSR